MPPELEGRRQHDEPENAQAKLEDQKPYLSPALEQVFVSPFFCFDVVFSRVGLSFEKVGVFVVVLLLQVNGINHNQSVRNNSAEGTIIFSILPVSFVTPVHNLALHEDIEEPHGVIGDIVHDGAAVGEDREGFKTKGLVCF